jgi:putative transposon-encoded protein
MDIMKKNTNRFRPVGDVLEERRLLTLQVSGSGISQIVSFAGVGFAKDPVATIFGTVNGFVDNNPSDYQAQVDWGDGTGMDSNTSLVTNGNDVLVKGTHIYQQKGTYFITVSVMGPGGQSASAQTDSASVAQMPAAASLPITVPTSYGGAKSLGVETVQVSGSGISQVISFAGVGFEKDPIATIFGTYNGPADFNPSDYHAQVNWGDSPQWDTETVLVTDNDQVLVKGTHIYQQQGTYPIVVYVTGPDGQTTSAQTDSASVIPMPAVASQPITVPTSFNGNQPLGVETVQVSGSGISQISALAGVSFKDKPIATIFGTYNGFQDAVTDDYKAQVNWGDSPQWDTNTTLVTQGDQVLVEGSHTYQKQGTYPIVVYVTGPDGQTTSAQTDTASVSPNTDSVTLTAPDVTDANSAAQNPYLLRLVYQSTKSMITGSSVPGASVQVVAPNGEMLDGRLVSQTPSGDASTITAYYAVTPPNGDWNLAPQGTYMVSLGGSPVTDKSGGQVPQGTLGSFSVSVTIMLIAQVPQLDMSVPSDGTIPLEVEAVGPSGNPDPGANGPVTVLLNGKVVANVNLTHGTANVNISATSQPGQDMIQAKSGKLLSGNVEVTVIPGLSDLSELFDKAANGLGALVETLNKLLEGNEAKSAEGFFEKALEDLKGPASILGTAANILNVVPLAKDLGLLAYLASQPASEQNEETFQETFSSAIKETFGLGVKAGVAIITDTNPIGAVGGLLLNTAIDKATDEFFKATLAPGFKTVGAGYYKSLKGLGTSPLESDGVSNNPGAGDPPPSVILVNPAGNPSLHNLSVAGQNVYDQVGSAPTRVVATFLDATGNTNPAAYAAFISWGDGNFTQGMISALPGGGFAVTGSDTYASAGIYSVNVVVVSIDGSTASSYSGATVYNPGPTGSTPAPVASVLAPGVNSENADWETPYTFSVVYQDSALVSTASLTGGTVAVQPPSGSVISAQAIGKQVLGTTDARGDGSTIVVTYEFTPPGGNWYAAPPGMYKIILGGSPVTDLSGHPVTQGNVGTFQKAVPPTLVVASSLVVDTSSGALASNSESLTFSGFAEAGSTVKVFNGSTVVSTTQAGSDGSWSVNYQAPQAGTYNFTAAFTDGAGHTSLLSEATQFVVDNAPPTSTALPLPHTTASTSFTVSWAGSDNAGGSGVGTFDVYVSNNGGPFTLFQSQTLANSASFTGLPDHTYAFYTVATDAVGNVQPKSAHAEASTRVTIPVEDDFDGDGNADIAIYDQTSATFFIQLSGGGSRVQPFGNAAHVNAPVMGDFDGDGKADIAIYDKTAATFYILDSGGGSRVQPFGNPAHVNIPVGGDFDGDGKTDLAIYDQTAATFYILKSAGGSIVQPFGNPAQVNIPVPADFDGDGKTDLAIYDQAAAAFLAIKSGGGVIALPFGNSAHVNVPVPGDFDGDGKTDFAVYDQTAGVLLALETGGGVITRQFGNSAEVNIPLAGDFDDDGKTDIAIFDATNAEFFVIDSGGGSVVVPFGNSKHKNRPV